MSRLGDNPYRQILTDRAKLYGVHAPGSSFPHLELATTHLLHAVDRYLSTDAAVACLIPGTVFNGYHHEPFRQRQFLTAARPIALAISEMWQVAPGTFKYPGAAVIGHKRASTGMLNSNEIKGFLARQGDVRRTEFSIRSIDDRRTAWVLEQGRLPAASTGSPNPKQGADLMPRTAVCIEIINEGGAEYRVNTPELGTPYGFTVKDAKALRDERFAGHVAPRFIHRMAQSVNLLPFFFGEHCAPRRHTRGSG